MKPKINILIRTSQRPKFFKDCINSIFQQTYENIKLIICIDDPKSRPYVEMYRDYIEKKYPDSVIVAVDRIPKNPDSYKVWQGLNLYHAPYNMYFNDMHTLCDEGYIMYLDDDDMFIDRKALQIISDKIAEDTKTMLMWRVLFPDRIIPSPDNLGRIVAGDISGIGFAYPVEYKEHGSWDDYSFCDFRVISKLATHLEIKTIDKVLTGIQGTSNIGGLGNRIDKSEKPKSANAFKKNNEVKDNKDEPTRED